MVERENQDTTKIGPLQSQVVVTLHTIQATKLWQGRRAIDGNPKTIILGLPAYISRLNAMHHLAAFNDPYADWALIKVETRQNKCRKELLEISKSVESAFLRLPKQISVSDNLNVNPIDYMLISKSPLGFNAVYLLTEYDELVRKILQLRHIGLIGRMTSDDFVQDASKIMRSLFGVAQHYKNAGVTRDDMAANNARAIQAKEKFGLPPKDILEGTSRSEFAPVIIKRKMANLEPVIKDEKTEHFIPDQEENARSSDED